MALRIQIPGDPTGLNPGASLLASCDGSRNLQEELRRYCNGQLAGRSFLVAGLRGSGKTWLVEGAVGELRGTGSPTRMRALRVAMNGPHLFEVLKKPTKEIDPELERYKKGKLLFQRVLETIVYSLHSELSAEFVRRFRDLAGQHGDPRLQDPRLHELAAKFEISLPEGPTPAEVREFWHLADALERGVMHPARGRIGRGMLELSAMSGLGYAYTRVAGEVREEFSDKQSASDARESSGRQWAEQITALAKPFTAVIAGAAVTAGSLGKHDIGPAALLGLAAAALAAIAFQLASHRVRRDEYKRDYTFLPKTDAASLERVLPDLILRVKRAGLAPVIIADELDKIDNLWQKLIDYQLLDHFKKLFGEQVFTCLLVNRSFMEELTDREDAQPYAAFHSYFSRRAYVSFEPAEVHDYLERLMEPFRG